MENNRECYHCVANHPELTISLYEYGFGYQRSPANEEGMAAFERDRRARAPRNGKRWTCRRRKSSVSPISSPAFARRRLPLDRDGESQTLDAKVASKKLLGGFERADLGGLSFWTQPNSWHHFMSDHIVTFCVIPLVGGQDARAHEVARAQGRARRHRLRREQPHRRVARDERPGPHACRVLAARRGEQRIRAGPVFAVHRRSRREVLRVVHRPACRLRRRARHPGHERRSDRLRTARKSCPSCAEAPPDHEQEKK